MFHALILMIVMGATTDGPESAPASQPAVTRLLSAIAPPGAEMLTTAGTMRGVIERFETDRRSVGRFFNVQTSAARRQTQSAFFRSWRELLDKLDFEKLDVDDRVDYVLLRNQIEHEQRDLEIETQRLTEMAELIPFAETIGELEQSRRTMKPVDSRRAAERLAAMVKQIEEVRKAAEEGLKPAPASTSATSSAPAGPAAIRVKKTVANRAVNTIAGLRRNLSNWFGFYNGYDPMFTWWVGEPYRAVDKALDEYGKFVREKLVGVKADDDKTIIGDPIGRDAIMSELAYEMIPYTPEELMTLADREFAWCETEVKKASHDMGCGDDWKKALERVKNDFQEPGTQPELVRQLAAEAVEFLDQHDLITIPPLARDTWRMEMLSPEAQLVSPFFLGGETIQVAFPTNTMAHDQKMMSMRGNNKHFARATVFHELMPGHGLQAYMNSRYRTYRGPFGTAFWTEGWALYWETLLWDLNFPKSPEDRVGMLFWRMHRCARIKFSLSFHLEKMTPQECVDFLVDRVGHERDNATAEVRRSFGGGYGPLYQCAYMLGAMQFRAMRRELVESGRMTHRQFHDAIMHENNMPIEMVRAVLTRQKLGRDFSASWKFYGELK